MKPCTGRLPTCNDPPSTVTGRGGCPTDLKTALRPYRRRLQREAGLGAFFCGLTAGLAVGAAALLFRRLLPGRLSARGALLLSLGAFAVACVLFDLLRRPSWKQTALRVDGLGLGDRTATMVEFQDQTGDLYDMQRQDALDRLQTISPKQLSLRWPKKWIIAAACLAALTAALFLAPASLWRRGGEASAIAAPETEESLLIRELLQDAAAQIDASGLSEEEKEALRRRLQDLMDQIAESGEMGLAALASAVSETDVLLEDIGDLERVNTILGELMKTTLLRDLALALSAQEESMFRAAMRELQNQFLTVSGPDRQRRLEQAAAEIDAALDRVPGAKGATVSSDYLSYCFSLFAGDLRATARAVSVGVDGAEEIEENVRQMSSRLSILFSGESTDAARKMALSDLMAQQAADQAGGGGDNANGEGGGGGPQFTSQLVTVGAEGVAGGLEEERERFSTNETVYDPAQDAYLDGGYVPGKKDKDGTAQRRVVAEDTPLSGQVNFQQVYGQYYARLLERLDQMAPESLEQVNLYFDGLIQLEKNTDPDQ